MINNDGQLAWSIMVATYMVFSDVYLAWPETVAGLHGQ